MPLSIRYTKCFTHKNTSLSCLKNLQSKRQEKRFLVREVIHRNASTLWLYPRNDVLTKNLSVNLTACCYDLLLCLISPLHPTGPWLVHQALCWLLAMRTCVLCLFTQMKQCLPLCLSYSVLPEG